ncbi:hypothetical protein [Rhodococcus erythropolis]|uniref:Mce-associated membrane protein n=1 Tax=Rhodococcus erythropolis TaxID=1833 RepID=A0AAX3ZY80_RHOER|nr:hypothetical protein [Rhodococcus erythropolis]WMN01705.1 hypothetical protein QIE55_30805 [Rhodococcus erythropolis]
MKSKISRLPLAFSHWSANRRRFTMYLGLMLAGTLAAIALSFAFQLNDHHRVADAQTQARDRATVILPDVLSYDFNTVDAHFDDVLPSLGGDLRDQFENIGNEVIIPSAKARQVVTSATVVESSVVSASTDQVTLLFYVNQSTTSTDSTVPRLDGSRVRVAMAEQEGAWVMTEMTPV